MSTRPLARHRYTVPCVRAIALFSAFLAADLLLLAISFNWL